MILRVIHAVAGLDAALSSIASTVGAVEGFVTNTTALGVTVVEVTDRAPAGPDPTPEEVAAALSEQWAAAAGLHHLGVAPELPEGVRWVAHTITDSAGRPLVPEDYPAHLVSLEVLPTTRLDVHYRGLIHSESDWRLEDVDASGGPNRGTPTAGAHPVRRVVYQWTTDPDAGPVLRGAVAEYLATDGRVVMSIPWPGKPYGLALGPAPDGQATSTDAGHTRRGRVLRRLHRLGGQGVATYVYAVTEAGGSPLPIGDYGAALVALVAPHARTYEEGNDPALAAAIAAAAQDVANGTASPALAWLAVPITAARLEGGVMVSKAATVAEHMADELIDPGAPPA